MYLNVLFIILICSEPQTLKLQFPKIRLIPKIPVQTFFEPQRHGDTEQHRE